jgi:hypothetical protein
MEENYSALSARLAGRKSDWTEIAKGFAEKELWDGEGNPPSAQTARLTWFRVQSDAKKREARIAAATGAVAAQLEPKPVELRGARPKAAARTAEPQAEEPVNPPKRTVRGPDFSNLKFATIRQPKEE